MHPDGNSVLVFVEGVEHSLLSDSEMDVGKFPDTARPRPPAPLAPPPTEAQEPLHALEGHTVPGH